MKRINGILQTMVTSAATAIVIVMIGFAPLPRIFAQSTKVAGRDVPANLEMWFSRVGLVNPNVGCDTMLEYYALNTAQIDDCSTAKNLADLQLRGLTINGVPTTQGAAGADAVLTKTVGSIANNTATTVLTVSVPNAAESATIPIVINAALGAGGAVGADECTATAYGQVVVTRTAGLATVATATTLADTGSACVAGATTLTLAYSVTSMTGANSVAQTFNIQVTVARGGGSSTNHVANIQADVLNANAAGITIS